ncbi:hypothetical protein GIB67_017838 [Kingdonia uniflora]|uniref:Uncharacterized protein n=1 Tax=Kingdonia uniflora TaxID=39325 RepID=A0A7J7MNM8_9MAGN|nr:hypothetical protein GIB67_017838 [Kingdonia uniflora]
MLAFSTTVTGEVAQGQKRIVEPLGGSGEKVAEVRSASVDDLKEVEDRANLEILQGKEGTNQMVIKKMSLRINDLESGLARELETSKALLSAQAELSRRKIMRLRGIRGFIRGDKVFQGSSRKVDALAAKDQTSTFESFDRSLFSLHKVQTFTSDQTSTFDSFDRSQFSLHKVLTSTSDQTSTIDSFDRS